MESLHCKKYGRSIQVKRSGERSGGEGVVRKTDVPGFVAKIYHQPSNQKIKKLRAMVNDPPADPTAAQNHVSIAWPVDLLSTSDGHTVGYLMPEIQGGTVLNNVYVPKVRKKKAPGFDWKYLHTTAKNIASAVSAIHNKGYVIGDVNPQNILVNNQAAVSIIDTDSFQVRDPHTHELFRCPVGSPGFTPVELLTHNTDFSQIDRSEVHDRFGLAIIIYLLIFCGNHPYSGKWKGNADPPQDQNSWVKARAWPYSKNSPVEPAANSVPLKIVHPALRECFHRAFGDGHIRSRFRPTAAEWYRALNIASAALKQCSTEPSHWFDSTNSTCYWCDRKSASGYDYFPPAQLFENTTVSKPSLQFPYKQKSTTRKITSAIPQSGKASTIPSSAAPGQKSSQTCVPAKPYAGQSKSNNPQMIIRIARSDMAKLSAIIVAGYAWGMQTLRWSGDEIVNLKQILIHSIYLVILSLSVIIERRITNGLAVPDWLLENRQWVRLVLLSTTGALYAALSKFYQLKPTALYDFYFLAILMLLVFVYRYYKIGFMILSLTYFFAFSHFLVLLPMLMSAEVESTGFKIASGVLGCLLLSVIVALSNPGSKMKYVLPTGIKAKWTILRTGGYGPYVFDAIGTSIIMSVIIWYLAAASIIPAVPMHVRYSGIFYNVEKIYSSDGNYHYGLEKLSPPWYKFWQNNIFYLRRALDRNDKIYSFAAVFAPFCLPGSDSNRYIHLTNSWDFYDVQTKKWTAKRKFNWKMKGGRWGGWRTYESIDAADIEPGLWRIRILTVQGHLVGEIVFRIAMGYGESWNFSNSIY